jgi:phytoene desaturase
MSVQKEARDEAYDVVVVGSGMGGLSAGAALAKAGRKVLVVERHDRPGGCAHSFQRKKYRFDSAVHLTSGCEQVGYGGGAMIDDLLSLLGVRDQCTFHRVEPFYLAVFPDLRRDVPSGVEEYIQCHVELFPGEEKGLRKLMRLHTRVARELKKFPSDLSSYDLLNLPTELPLHHEYRAATLAQVMDQHLTDPRLKALLAAPWGYLGLPPSRLSFLRWVSMLVSFLHLGAWYCEGTFQNLANALVAGLRKHGGELLLMSSVRRIALRDGRVEGVVLDNGQRISAPVVISNADARQTFEDLVGAEHLPPAFLTRLRALRPSLSVIAAFMATDLDLRSLGARHEIFAYSSWDHDQNYADNLAGRPSSVIISVPTLADPSLAPPGEHLVSACALVPWDLAGSWRQDKDRYADALVDRVDEVLPGLKGRLTFLEKASPRTVERFTLNFEGAIYGWEQSPENAGADRLARTTSVPGLYLAGQWTQPGAGVISTIVSGLQTAQVVQGFADIPGFMASIGMGRPPGAPPPTPAVP